MCYKHIVHLYFVQRIEDALFILTYHLSGVDKFFTVSVHIAAVDCFWKDIDVSFGSNFKSYTA